MKINANQIRPGNVLEHQGKLWRVLKIAHTQPGKGGAFVQAEMKEVTQGTKLNERFRSTETIDRAVLEQKQMQYLFSESDMHTFMDMESYEQISISEDIIADAAKWLQESMEIQIEMHEGNPIGVELPNQIIMEILEADAAIKGQTVSSSYKPAKVENGETVMVPQFIESGEKIVVSTADGTYVERAK